MAEKKIPENARSTLLNAGVNSLPANPSKNGFNSAQVKGAMNRQSLLLLDWMGKLDDSVVGIEDTMASQITEVKVDGVTVSDGHEADIPLGDAMGMGSQGLTLTLSTLQETVPKEMTLGAQEDTYLLAESGGHLKKVSAGKLDYTRLKVQQEEDLAQVGVNDFLFIKEG